MNVEATTPEESLVLEFFTHWEKRDIDAIVDYFAPDGSYIDMPLPPRHGQQAIRAYLEEIFGAFTVKIETLALASRGPLVMTERIDYLIRTEQPTVDLPVMGVMVIRNGKIAEWRDYLDIKTVESGLAVSYDATGDDTETVSIRNVQS